MAGPKHVHYSEVSLYTHSTHLLGCTVPEVCRSPQTVHFLPLHFPLAPLFVPCHYLADVKGDKLQKIWGWVVSPQTTPYYLCGIYNSRTSDRWVLWIKAMIIKWNSSYSSIHIYDARYIPCYLSKYYWVITHILVGATHITHPEYILGGANSTVIKAIIEEHTLKS